MIDIHSHFLPEIDDGPYDVTESLNILRMASEDGIEEVVATPHSKMVWEKMSIDQLRDRFESYKSRVMNEGIDVKLHLGMENRIEPGLEEKFDSGHALTLANTRYILVELPFEEYPIYADEVIFALQVRGLVPVLAHPERNGGIQQDIGIAAKLTANGVVMQITADSFTGSFGGQAKKCAVSLLRAGLVHVLAADAHMPTGHRRPRMSTGREIVAKIGGANLAAAVVNELPKGIVRDADINLSETLLKPKRRFWQFFG